MQNARNNLVFAIVENPSNIKHILYICIVIFTYSEIELKYTELKKYWSSIEEEVKDIPEKSRWKIIITCIKRDFDVTINNFKSKSSRVMSKLYSAIINLPNVTFNSMKHIIQRYLL